MKKIICFSLLVIFSLPFALAQVNTGNVEIVLSDVYKRDKKIFESYIGADDKGFYIARNVFNSELCIIEHYDHDLKLVYSKQLDLKFKKSDREAEAFYLFEGVIYVFSSFDDKETKQYNLYLEKYDKKSMEKIGEISVISSIDYKEVGQLSTITRTSFSKDSSKLMIYCYLISEKGENLRFYTSVYDLETMESWSKVITIPYKGKEIAIRDFLIDNDGNIYLTGVLLETGYIISPYLKIDHYTILVYSNNGEELVEYPIKTPGKTISDLKIGFLDNNEIICAGFYTYDDNSEKSIAGSFYGSFDNETKSIEDISFNDFYFNNVYYMKKDIILNKETKGKRLEIDNLTLDKMFFREDGTMVLIGEQAYTNKSTSSPSEYKSTSSPSEHYNNDIVIVAYDSDGENEWNKIIPKDQASFWRRESSSSSCSYLTHLKENKIYIICMLNKENMLLNKDVTQYPENMGRKDAFLVLCEIDKNGNLKKDCIINIEDIEAFPMPFISWQISKDESVMYASTRMKTKERLIKFIFE
jgi:hypothetical protein